MFYKIKILAVFAAAVSSFSLFADTLSDVKDVLDKNTAVFQQSGAEMDSLGARIRNKIVFSWNKGFEHFRLATSSATNIIPNIETTTATAASKSGDDPKVEEIKQTLSVLGKDSSGGGQKKLIEAARGFSAYSKTLDEMSSDSSNSQSPMTKAQRRNARRRKFLEK